MQIKEVSEITGISSYNIRFYEKMELIKPARNAENDYREYTQDDIDKLRFIRLLRSLGFSISTIQSISDNTAIAKDMINTQIGIIERRIESLHSIRELCRLILHKDLDLNPQTVDKYLEKVAVLEQNGTLFWDMLTSEVENMVMDLQNTVTGNNKQLFSILFLIDHTSDESAREKVVSTKFWCLLIKKLVVSASEFEIRCWNDETEGIEFAQKHGIPLPNPQTKELVFRGPISDLFVNALLENCLSSNGTMLWFTVNLYEGEKLILSSSHWGSEITLPGIDIERVDSIINWSKQYAEIISVDVHEDMTLDEFIQRNERNTKKIRNNFER